MATRRYRARRRRRTLTAQQRANRAATARPPISYGQNSYRAVSALNRARRRGKTPEPHKKSHLVAKAARVVRTPQRKVTQTLSRSLYKSATVRRVGRRIENLRKWGGCKPRPNSRKAGASPRRAGKGGSIEPRKFLPWC